MTRAGLASRTAALVRLGATAAVVGGALRIVSSFVPFEANAAALEVLYGVIDLSLLFGLLAVYIVSAEAVGIAGLVFFLIAVAGLASIVGPDTQAFGIDFYRVGALVFVIGLAGLSVQLLRARRMTLSALLWIGTLAASLLSAMLPQAFPAAGVLIGTGFVLAGVDMLRARAAPALAPV